MEMSVLVEVQPQVQVWTGFEQVSSDDRQMLEARKGVFGP